MMPLPMQRRGFSLNISGKTWIIMKSFFSFSEKIICIMQKNSSKMAHSEALKENPSANLPTMTYLLEK
jgi:hypothetical protein